MVFFVENEGWIPEMTLNTEIGIHYVSVILTLLWSMAPQLTKYQLYKLLAKPERHYFYFLKHGDCAMIGLGFRQKQKLE